MSCFLIHYRFGRMEFTMGKRLGRKRRERIETIVFTIPAILLVTIMIYIPFIMSGYYSLTEWNGIAKEAKFIGLDNFKALFSGNKEFINAISFTLRYTLVFLIFVNIFALALAVILVKKMKLSNLFRGVFFIPYIMSMTIVGFIWKFIFSQGFSSLYKITNWDVFNLSWLGDTKLVFFSVVFVGIWQSVGFYMVLYIAGLQSISKDILEAATVDGASGRATFFRITLPLLIPSIITCVFMSLTNALKVFDIILALTKGGPGGSTYSVTLDIYREAFQNNNYGLGSAKSVVFFIMVLVLTQLVLKGLRSKEVDL